MSVVIFLTLDWLDGFFCHSGIVSVSLQGTVHFTLHFFEKDKGDQGKRFVNGRKGIEKIKKEIKRKLEMEVK